MLDTLGNIATADSLDSAFLRFLIAVRVLLAWYRFLSLLAALLRILLIADL